MNAQTPELVRKVVLGTPGLCAYWVGSLDRADTFDAGQDVTPSAIADKVDEWVQLGNGPFLLEAWEATSPRAAGNRKDSKGVQYSWRLMGRYGQAAGAAPVPYVVNGTQTQTTDPAQAVALAKREWELEQARKDLERERAALLADDTEDLDDDDDEPDAAPPVDHAATINAIRDLVREVAPILGGFFRNGPAAPPPAAAPGAIAGAPVPLDAEAAAALQRLMTENPEEFAYMRNTLLERYPATPAPDAQGK